MSVEGDNFMKRIRGQHLWSPAFCRYGDHCWHTYIAHRNREECCHCGEVRLITAYWNQEKEK